MSVSAEDLKKVMANKTDEELYDVVHGHSNDYMPDTVEIAKLELSFRNLDAPTVSTLSTTVEGQKQLEQAPLEWSYRILAFFTSTIFFAIPVILAHRHYIEKGQRRKARDERQNVGDAVVFHDDTVNHVSNSGVVPENA